MEMPQFHSGLEAIEEQYILACLLLSKEKDPPWRFLVIL